MIWSNYDQITIVDPWSIALQAKPEHEQLSVAPKGQPRTSGLRECLL
jgi:hypothetical protein